jgi:hypothetical protein
MNVIQKKNYSNTESRQPLVFLIQSDIMAHRTKNRKSEIIYDSREFSNGGYLCTRCKNW